MDIALIAMGPMRMIGLAIQEHRRQTQGRYPSRIVLHPVVMVEFIGELVQAYGHDGATDCGGHVFMNTAIDIDAKADRPQLITWDNRVEYL